MKVFIVGSKGQLGKEIIKMLEHIRCSVYEYDLPELNITQYDMIQSYIFKHEPDIVINCAAMTDVDLCESEIEKAYKVNALGPRNLAVIANKIDAKIVHISTDYVFPGNKEGVKYQEDDKPQPINVYGKSKLLGEKYLEKFSDRYFIIRTAWLYGDGENFVTKMLELSKKRTKLKVVDDQVGSPTSTVDLARVIIKLMQTEQYGLYHGTCKGSCTWYEFAKKIFKYKDIDIEINKTSSEEFNSPAPRPEYSVLDNFMLKLIDMNEFRHWEESLKEYLNNL